MRRRREGIYSAQVIGPVGKRVQIILLDQRDFRSPLKTGFVNGEPGEGRRGKYAANSDPGATVLGADQWKWLADQLRQPAELRIIGASFQFVADESGSECWGNIFAWMRAVAAPDPRVLCPGRHVHQRRPASGRNLAPGGRRLAGRRVSALRHYQQQPECTQGNFSKAKVRFANELNSYRLGLMFFDVNFGFIAIDWDAADPVVRLQVRDELGGVVLQQRLTLSELAPRWTCGEKVACALRRKSRALASCRHQARIMNDSTRSATASTSSWCSPPGRPIGIRLPAPLTSTTRQPQSS